MPASVQAPPASLLSTNPLKWVTVFGPGAIIASLTIGTGELVFSSRGGALFGYRVLFLFAMISVCKWVLVYSTARHMVYTGVHPLKRWVELPGPRGWLPGVMFVFAMLCIPIWVSFHSSVLGDLFAGLTHTKHYLNGATIHLWGLLILAIVLTLAWVGGYGTLERAQLAVVAIMLLLVAVAVVLLKPDWGELLAGLVIPRPLSYPNWIQNATDPDLKKIAAQPIWVEASLYVGVIGGASYDYLAYTSFLRNKRWGLAGAEPQRPNSWSELSDDDWARLKQWTRAPLIDCSVSFLIVMIFSAVFVASGWLVLAPRQQIPGDGNFLEHQAQFVTQLHPLLFPIYVGGTLCAMLGTLYGTLEIAPAIFRECIELVQFKTTEATSMSTDAATKHHGARIRQTALAWTGLGAFFVLAVSFVYQTVSGADKPPGLTTLLIPASLFTGVLSCGIICLLNPWIDRHLPMDHRPSRILSVLNGVAGVAFLLLGIKGYWDFGGARAFAILMATVAAGGLLARFVPMRQTSS